MSQLVGRAGDARRALAIRACGSGQMIDPIARASEQHAELVLLDPGSTTCRRARFHAALERLEMPFIEVRDHRAGALEEAGIRTNGGARHEALVQGCGAQSYRQRRISHGTAGLRRMLQPLPRRHLSRTAPDQCGRVP